MSPSSSLVPRRNPARPGTVRGHNLGLALRCVAVESGKISRAGISARTGMNRSTASSLVDELISGGLIREVGARTRTGVGRPATVLALASHGPAGLGLDINVDYVAASIVDLTGTVRYQHVVTQDQRGHSSTDVLDRVARLAEDALAAVADSDLVPCGTAVAVPGLIDTDNGAVALAPNLGWRDLPVLDVLRARVPGWSITLDNEANFAALSEQTLLRSEQSYLYINGQIGVGAGIVLGGQLYRGRHGWGGEVGHQTIDREGPVCACGRRGCLEQYAGQEAILRAAGITDIAGTHLGVRSTAELIKNRAEEGDPRAVAALARAGGMLGVVLADCLNLLDVDRIVLGGIYRYLARWITPEVEKELSARFVGARWLRPTVDVAMYGAEAPALGAARSVIRAVIDDPLVWLSR